MTAKASTLVIKTPALVAPVKANVVAFGNSGYVFLDAAQQSYLYGRPAQLAATLREWADRINPRPVGVRQ